MKSFAAGFFTIAALVIVIAGLAPRQTLAGTCTCNGNLVPVITDKVTCDSNGSVTSQTCVYDETITGSNGSGTPVKLDCPLGNAQLCNDPRILIGRVIQVVLSLVGSIALVLFIYGGLSWMLAAGNTEAIKRGRDTLVWASLGLLVIFSSYTIVNFIILNIPKS